MLLDQRRVDIAPVTGPGPTAPRARRGTFAPRRSRVVLGLSSLVLVVAIAVFMTYDLQGSLSYALDLRFRKVAAMVLVGFASGHSTVVFHAITHNRILTPSLMGFDSLYILIQTASAFFLGTFAFTQIDERVRFGATVLAMLVFSGLLYRLVFAKAGTNVLTLVLVGIVAGSVFNSGSSLVSRLIDPNEYVTLQDRLFASFATVDRATLAMSAVILVLASLATIPLLGRLDAASLGWETAQNIGIDPKRLVNVIMIIVALQVSVATALVGPITFLGLLVANLAYRLTGTFRHRHTIPVAGTLAASFLVGGQFILEELLGSTTRLTIVISFIGGLYFIVLLLTGPEARSIRNGHR